MRGFRNVLFLVVFSLLSSSCVFGYNYYVQNWTAYTAKVSIYQVAGKTINDTIPPFTYQKKITGTLANLCQKVVFTFPDLKDKMSQKLLEISFTSGHVKAPKSHYFSLIGHSEELGYIVQGLCDVYDDQEKWNSVRWDTLFTKTTSSPLPKPPAPRPPAPSEGDLK